MKTYKLLKDLPTFKAGDEFYRGASGHLYTTDKENGREIVAYRNEILAIFLIGVMIILAVSICMGVVM